LQGDGTRIITMEEFGIYRYAASILAQAKIITQGSGGAPGRVREPHHEREPKRGVAKRQARRGPFQGLSGTTSRRGLVT
jgi:hypothetical protein